MKNLSLLLLVFSLFIYIGLFGAGCKGIQTGDSKTNTNINSNNPVTIDPFIVEQCRKCSDPDFRADLSSSETCDTAVPPVCKPDLVSVEACKAEFENAC